MRTDESKSKHTSTSMHFTSPFKILDAPVKNLSIIKAKLNERQCDGESVRDSGFFLMKKSKKSLLVPQVVTIPATPPTSCSVDENNSGCLYNHPLSLPSSTPLPTLSRYFKPETSPPEIQELHGPEMSLIASATNALSRRRQWKSFGKSLSINIPLQTGSYSDTSCGTTSPTSYDSLLQQPHYESSNHLAASQRQPSFVALNMDGDDLPHYIDSSSDTTSSSDQFVTCLNTSFPSSNEFPNEDADENEDFTNFSGCNGTQSAVSLKCTGTAALKSNFPEDRVDLNDRRNRLSRGFTVDRTLGKPESPREIPKPRSSSVPPKRI
ncbi:uncharacterized protein LOC108670787 [Hyalella azteca]|uniref:Uncharacterized protein LOC108670787 n=1 Tax=Hyalella azteca TaxID=294128 RepID=A0A8B7NJD6_HYAAZ|nr:uncharacterized protein LOC108670787 [Hyalella azteca]